MAIGENHPPAGPGDVPLSPVEPDRWASERSPLGAHPAPSGDAWTFALWSRSATRVLLEIHRASTGDAPPLDSWPLDYWMVRGDDDVWRARIAGVTPGTLYAYRCWGPNFAWDPAWSRGGSLAGFVRDVDDAGHRFNPNKLLIDPYARELSHDRETPEMIAAGHNAAMYLSGPGIYAPPGAPARPRREVDTGPFAPRSITVAPLEVPVGERPPFAQKDAVLYEVHPRGLTRHPSSSELRAILAPLPEFADVEDVPAGERGTYRGAARMAPYLRALGVNTLELLPVHESCNDTNPSGSPASATDAARANYWGYMTYAFFAPDRRHAYDDSAGGPTREIREMVRSFHAAGLKVHLDVVYNHSGEGGLADEGDGPDPDTAEILCFRGIDNAAYYVLDGAGGRFYWQTSGCGNNLDAASAPVQRLILDSLEYWAGQVGVDGFRFDLAPVLGRGTPRHGYSRSAALLEEIAELAARHGVDIVAEPWDLADTETGSFPPGWAEWNDHYRDRVRDFEKGTGDVRAFIDAMNGSYAEYADQGGPQKSVNLVVAHDGFNLLDLVSYGRKDNLQPWPFGPSEGGADDNRSWDSGGDPALRRQRMRNLLAIQVLSRGTPLLVGGDEIGRTQNGNNNPYNLDNAALWINWRQIASHQPNRLAPGAGGDVAARDSYGEDKFQGPESAVFHFTRGMLALRRDHECLRQDRYADFALDSGGDVTYLFRKEDGERDLEGWERSVHLHIDGSEVGDHDLLALINVHHEAVAFRVPPPAPGLSWRRIVDTAAWAEPAGNLWPAATGEVIVGDYLVHARSVVVLEEL